MAVEFEEEKTDFAQIQAGGKPTLTDRVAKMFGLPTSTATLLLGVFAVIILAISYYMFSSAHVFTGGPDKASIDRLQNAMRPPNP